MLLSSLLASSPVVPLPTSPCPPSKSTPNLSISSYFPKYCSSHIIPQFHGSLGLTPVPAVLPWGIQGLLQNDPKAFHLLLRKHPEVAAHLTQAPALRPHASLSPQPGSLSPCLHVWKSSLLLKGHVRDHCLWEMSSDSPDSNQIQFYFLWNLTANVFDLEEEHFVYSILCKTQPLYTCLPPASALAQSFLY